MALRILSWNVNGLNSKPKRNRIHHVLQKQNLDVICLQETHVMRTHRKILQNKRLGQEFISADKVKKRGVVIYVKEKFEAKLLFKDEEGRYLAVEITAQGDKLLMLGIYAPNEGKAEFYKKIHDVLLDYMDYKIILMGDLNGVVSTLMDRSQRQKISNDGRLPKTFFEMMDNFDMIDTWRLKNPLEKDFTFFSDANKSCSRLDYIWTTRDLAMRINKSEICPKTCSDHNAVLLELKLFPQGLFRWRMNDALLRSEQIVEKAQKTIRDYFEINLNTEVEKRVIWDASKAVMRGFLIQQNVIRKKAQNEKKGIILNQLREKEKKLRSNPKNQQVQKEIKALQSQFSQI